MKYQTGKWLERLEAKIDRVESKLDELLAQAAGGMTPGEVESVTKRVTDAADKLDAVASGGDDSPENARRRKR